MGKKENNGSEVQISGIPFQNPEDHSLILVWWRQSKF